MDKNKFNIKEDRDHFDYIFSHRNVALYEGSDFQRHRKMVRRFEKGHKYEILTLNLIDKKVAIEEKKLIAFLK